MGWQFVHRPDLPPLPEMEFRREELVWANGGPVDMDALAEAGYVVETADCAACGGPLPAGEAPPLRTEVSPGMLRTWRATYAADAPADLTAAELTSLCARQRQAILALIDHAKNTAETRAF